MSLPKYVLPKRLKGGTVYYWNLPTWARRLAAERKTKCPVGNERLKGDLVQVIRRAEHLNAVLDAWRIGDVAPQVAEPVEGSIDWLIRWFRRQPKYLKTSERTRRDYDLWLDIFADLQLEDGMGRLGAQQAAWIEPYHADGIYERLQWVDDPDPEDPEKTIRRRRLRTANGCMQAARRMWNLAVRAKLVEQNPFSRMGLETTGGNTVPASRAQVYAFVKQADKMGYPSMATAAVLAFELCQRSADVIGTIAWSGYTGQTIRVVQSKTGKLIDVPLYDEDGTALFPEVVERLTRTPVRGPLIVMRDRPDRLRGEYLPYQQSWFQHLFREIADAAKLPKALQFRTFRHGGLTELGDSEATDQEMMALGGHETRQMLTVYSRRTAKQIRNAARKRRALRLEGDDAA